MEIDVIVEHLEFGTGKISGVSYDTGEPVVSVLWDNGHYDYYMVDELEFTEIKSISPEKHLRQALGILKEFVGDVENRGLETIGEDWPELLITYQSAVEVLS